MAISDKLVLFKYLLHQFGYEKFEDLQKKFSDEELKAETADRSIFYAVLRDRVLFPADDFLRFDQNIIEHLGRINRHRQIKINLKYYQYLSLLFTEYYLDRFFADRDQFSQNLEQFRSAFDADTEIGELPPFDRDDLNLIAYWQATGSGKTFTLHFNILQYQHYTKRYKAKLNNLILLTPSESLSRQHLRELEESGIEADYYLNNKAGSQVKVIDLYKIRKAVFGQGVTIPVAEFGQENALFVDEGHKGNDADEGLWRELREEMGYNGFTFEYSATFGQVGGDLQDYYAKKIIFDYSYKYFHRDGYGKNYFIHNITEAADLNNTEVKRRYLMCNLLLFAQQKLYYRLNQTELEEYKIENPLLIFVGHTVNPKAKKQTEIEDNEETISDVKILLEFWQDLLTNRSKYEEIIQQVLNCHQEQFCQEFHLKLHWLFERFETAQKVYDAVIRDVLNAHAPDILELYTLKDATGEIGLKVKNNEHYFGLINIGDVSKFKTSLENQFVFHRDTTTTVSLFDSLSDKIERPINILIGARKFIEGWNNYRVSSIGLINFGKTEGSQIIQLFGRGVRLRGKENSLKRSTEKERLDDFMPIVETLNIFGLNADYMKRFEDDLKNEGILKRTYEIPVSVQLYGQQTGKSIESLKLIVPQKKKGVPAFNQTKIVKLACDAKTDISIKIILDLTTKNFATDSVSGTAASDSQAFVMKDLKAVEKFIDYDQLFLDLIRFKQSKGYDNLGIRRGSLKDLLSRINIELKLDGRLAVNSLDDIEKVQRIALRLLEKYADSYYRRHLRVYEGRHLESAILSGKNPVLSNLNYTVEIAETDDNGVRYLDFEQIRKKLEEFVIKAEADVSTYKGSSILLNAWFDKHLYQPLLEDVATQPQAFRIESIKPKGLNDGEKRFVGHLRSFVEQSFQNGKYTDCEFYLLRNSSVQTKGFGFYFSAGGGFFPDFLLWIKRRQNRSVKQYLSFIDPHGLRNEDAGFSSDKIQLHKYLKSEFPEVTGVTLNSFILAPSSFVLSGMQVWEREDKTTDLRTYSNNLNIYELGNGDDFSYIAEIVSKILS
jgi:hypothetical protein